VLIDPVMFNLLFLLHFIAVNDSPDGGRSKNLRDVGIASGGSSDACQSYLSKSDLNVGKFIHCCENTRDKSCNVTNELCRWIYGLRDDKPPCPSEYTEVCDTIDGRICRDLCSPGQFEDLCRPPPLGLSPKAQKTLIIVCSVYGAFGALVAVFAFACGLCPKNNDDKAACLIGLVLFVPIVLIIGLVYACCCSVVKQAQEQPTGEKLLTQESPKFTEGLLPLAVPENVPAVRERFEKHILARTKVAYVVKDNVTGGERIVVDPVEKELVMKRCLDLMEQNGVLEMGYRKAVNDPGGVLRLVWSMD
jgi:hypothetical protein